MYLVLENASEPRNCYKTIEVMNVQYRGRSVGRQWGPCGHDSAFRRSLRLSIWYNIVRNSKIPVGKVGKSFSGCGEVPWVGKKMFRRKIYQSPLCQREQNGQPDEKLYLFSTIDRRYKVVFWKLLRIIKLIRGRKRSANLSDQKQSNVP